MDLERLMMFLEVYRRGSVTGAARALGRAQPSVSYQIKALEEELGVLLFERRGPRLTATAQAAILVEMAIPLVEQFRNLTARLGEIQQLTSGVLRVASSHSVTTSVLWKAVARFRRAWPGVTLSIVNGSTDEIVRAVREGRADSGVTSVAVRDALLECRPLLEYDYWLVRPRGRVDAGFILPARGSALRRRVESTLDRGSRIAAEVSSLEIFPQLVRSGVGVTVLPAFALPQNRKGLQLKRLPEMGTDTISSVRSRSEIHHPAVLRFEEIVRRSFRRSRKKN